MKPMTPQQRTAIEHTTRLAQECLHPMFTRVDGLGVATILTFNSGYE